MAGLVPAIHVCLYRTYKTWMPGMTPGMTNSVSRLEQIAADDELLHLGRSLIDPQRADFPIEMLDHRADANAEATEHLHRPVDDAPRLP